MKSTCRIAGKLGIFVLLLTFIFVPVSAQMAVAAEAGAQGNPGPSGIDQLTEAQLAALAGASLVTFALVANSLTEDDSNATAQHTPAEHPVAVGD